MTTADLAFLDDWASTTFGKTARAAIAVLGVITATLTLLLASMVSDGSWVLTLAGVALAATSVRAAILPNITRLAVVAANLLLIPLLASIG